VGEETMRCPKISLITVFVLSGLLFLSCAPKGKPRVLVPAEFDLSKYKTVAVADFQGQNEEWGKRIASWLEEDLIKVKVEGEPYFKVIPRAQLREALENRKLQGSDLVDPEIASQVGRLLGLDAIFTGTVLEAHTEEWIYAYRRLGVILTAHVKFTAQVISTETGRVITDQTVSQIRKEDVTGGAELAEIESLDQPLTSCARQAVEKFIRKIAPHYVTPGQAMNP
jgi:curli biogenesis system outer membrane secretion channel CsgG